MVTQELLRELFSYEPSTGELINRRSRGAKARAGMVAGSYHKSTGRWQICIDGHNWQRSHLVWIWHNGSYDHGLYEVDHEDTNPLNDMIENLRLATSGQNKANRRIFKNNRSGHKGIHWSEHASRWIATIKMDGKAKTRGFVDLQDAISWRAQMAETLHAQYARG